MNVGEALRWRGRMIATPGSWRRPRPRRGIADRRGRRRGAAAAAGRSRMRHPRFVLLRLRSRRVRPALAWSAPTVAGPGIDMVSLDHAGDQVDEHRPLLRL